MYPEVRRNNPDCSEDEIQQMISVMWESADQSVKAFYEEKCEKEMKRYLY